MSRVTKPRLKDVKTHQDVMQEGIRAIIASDPEGKKGRKDPTKKLKRCYTFLCTPVEGVWVESPQATTFISLAIIGAQFEKTN